MTTDLVVVLPGIMGSTLRRKGKLVWAPSAGAVLRAIGVFGRSLQELTLPENIGDDHPEDGVEPVDLMPDLHALPDIWTPVKGYDRLVRRLHAMGYREETGASPGNLVLVPYDWRLSNRYNAERLRGIVQPALQRWREQGGEYAGAKVVFVCHSMGGLIARWYIENCGGADHTRKLITFGTPYRGAVKALEQLVNPRSGFGWLSEDLTRFVRSMPSLHQLLPEYACIEHGNGLAKIGELVVPELDTAMTADAMAFHTALIKAEADRPASLAMTHAIVGARQPTWTSIQITAGRVDPLDTIGADNDYGDSTVPLTGAIGHNLPLDTNQVRRIIDKHGNLQRNPQALDEMAEIITARPIRRRAPHVVGVRVTVPEFLRAGEDLPVTVAIEARHAIKVTVRDESGEEIHARAPRPRDGHVSTTFTDLPPGGYAVDVTGLHLGSPVTPVRSTVVIGADLAGA
jgi:pimeloyl-ACP methyl ester carboxylesterase